MLLRDINVALSHALDDPVTLYSEEGDTYTPSVRDFFIMCANALLYKGFYDYYRLIVRKSKEKTKVDISAGFELLNDFIATKLVSATGSLTFQEDNVSGKSGVLFDDIHPRLKEILSVVGPIRSSQSGLAKKSYALVDLHEVAKLYSSLPNRTASISNRIGFVGTTTEATPRKALRLWDYQECVAGDSFHVSYISYPNQNLLSSGSEDLQWNESYFNDLVQLALAYSRFDDGDVAGFQNIVSGVFSNYSIAPSIIKSVVENEEVNKAQP